MIVRVTHNSISVPELLVFFVELCSQLLQPTEQFLSLVGASSLKLRQLALQVTAHFLRVKVRLPLLIHGVGFLGLRTAELLKP
jgi:hypothetical protein